MGKYAKASTLPLTMRCRKVVLRKLEANQTLAASIDTKQASEIPREKMCSVLRHVLANLLLVHLSKDNVDSSGFALLPNPLPKVWSFLGGTVIESPMLLRYKVFTWGP